MSPAGMIEDILYGALTNGVNVRVSRHPPFHLHTLELSVAFTNLGRLLGH